MASIPPAGFDQGFEGGEEGWFGGVAGGEADVGGGVPVETLFWVGREERDNATNGVVLQRKLEWEFLLANLVFERVELESLCRRCWFGGSLLLGEAASAFSACGHGVVCGKVVLGTRRVLKMFLGDLKWDSKLLRYCRARIGRKKTNASPYSG